MCVCGLTGMGEYSIFAGHTQKNGANSIVVSFCRLVNKCSCLSFTEYIAHGLLRPKMDKITSIFQEKYHWKYHLKMRNQHQASLKQTASLLLKVPVKLSQNQQRVRLIIGIALVTERNGKKHTHGCIAIVQ